MPARRLPWLKLWPEAIRHEKVALLSDGEFRTWIYVLCASAEQPIRGRFASVEHAAVVTGRPAADMAQLVARGLLEYGPEGALWIHDWHQWQDKYPSDYVREDSTNAAATLHEGSSNDPPTLPLDTEAEEEERSKQKEREGATPGPPSQSGRGYPPNPPMGGGLRRRARAQRTGLTATEAFGRGKPKSGSAEDEARKMIADWARETLLGETSYDWPIYAAELGRSDLAPLEQRYVGQWLERARRQLIAEGVLDEQAGDVAIVER